MAGGYDLAHLQRIHRHLFGDVYDWAGEIRTVALAKSDISPCHSSGDWGRYAAHAARRYQHSE